jgi:hypothetical protein
MENAEIVRLAVEAEETGKESLGSATTKAAPDPGPRFVQMLRWLMGRGPFPRRRRAPYPA